MNERRVRAEEKKDKGERLDPEKELAKLKRIYCTLIEKISSGAKAPIEDVYKLKQAAEEGGRIYRTESGDRIEVPKSLCAEVYEKITNAMFESGDINGIGTLGEDDLLVAAAFDHKNVEIAIAAAAIIALRDPVRKEDLEFLTMSNHEEVRKMAKEKYFEDDVEVSVG